MIEDYEGFEVDQTVAALQLKYRNVSVSGTVFFPAGALQGTALGRSLDDAQALNHISWETQLLPLVASRTVGLRMRAAEPATEGGDLPAIVSFLRGGVVQVHLDVAEEDDGSGDWHLELYRGSVLIARSKTIARDVDVYVEIAATLDATNGAVELRIGEQLEFAFSGLNTAASGGPGCDSIRHKIDVNGGIGGTDSVWTVDDLYYASGFEFHGDVVVEGSLARGPGRAAQFVPSAGQNYDAVNEGSVHDGDGSYVRAASGVVAVDAYSFQPPRYGRGDPLALKVAAVARLESAGVAHLRGLHGDGVTEAQVGSVMDVTSTSYEYKACVSATNPLTGVAWRLGDALDGEVGVERA